MMKVNYADEKVIKEKPSIFLAGPTPRSKDVKSWRPDAIKILKQLEFEGTIYVPEDKNIRKFDYNDQVEWEREALYNATVIVFWVPRGLKDMPAFTTNVEFGYWVAKEPKKVIYGRPEVALKIKYLDWLYNKETKRNYKDTLEETLKAAIELIN